MDGRPYPERRRCDRRAIQETLICRAVLVYHSGKAEGGVANALQTQSAVPSARMPGVGGTRQAVLRKASAAPPGGDTTCIQARLRQQMAEGEQSLSPKPSAVRGVREDGTVHQGYSGRSHCTAPWRPEAVLGPEQLAGSLQEVS